MFSVFILGLLTKYREVFKKMEEVLCIVAIVERGQADKVVAAVKNAGASGATILYGRGTGEHEAKSFF